MNEEIRSTTNFARSRVEAVILIRAIIRLLVANSIISKETVRVLIGWFLYVPAVIVPIFAVVILLVALRKQTAHGISIINLIIASGVVAWLTLLVITGGRWAGSPPREVTTDSARMSIIVSIEALIALCWLAGGIGLLLRRRVAWAWAGSMVGAGALACLFMFLCAVAGAEFIYPDEELKRLKEFGASGYIFTLVACITWLCLSLTISLRLVFGLLQARKEFLGGLVGTKISNS